MTAVCGILLASDLVYQTLTLSGLNQRLDQERSKQQLQHEQAVKEQREAATAEIVAEESAQQNRLQNHAFISGDLARQRHEAEWVRRLAHDPEMAKSPVEQTLLHMEQVGKNPALAAKEALEQVAKLAAPPGSRIEVVPSGDRFAVRVAFRMSALSANESGAVTKHHNTGSMRREIEDLSARVVKALFDYCGSRGIEVLSVTCNHAMRRSLIPQNATEEERHELLRRAPVIIGRLYRVSLDREQARSVADWRRISVSKVKPLMKVEIDDLKTLQITGTSALTEPDPEGQLEF